MQVCNSNTILLSYCWESFSLLANSFKLSQESALEDYIEASVMLQYNSHW